MEFTLNRNYADLAPLSSDWNALLAESITHVPFLRYEYLSTWWTTRGGGEWPEAELAVVTARKDGRLAGIAPMFFAKNREGEPSLLLLGSIEISDYLDLIVRPGELACFVPGLLDFLGRPELPAWRALDWHNLPATSPSLPALKAEAEKLGWVCTLQPTYHAPSIPLKGDFETYLAGIDKKQRHEIRRKMRRAEESGQDVRWYFVQDGASLESEVEAFLALMAEDSEKATFLTPPMREQMQLSCRAAFENGWLQLAFLEVDGRKAAGYLNFDYLSQIWVYNSGVSREFMELSPGWVLLGHLLQWANENKRLEFDFMRGEEEYKYRFGAVDKQLVRAKVTR
ncbi:MAG TPA: GNAT family N-acetyltransferase [Anaerolineales bacterium]|nr:GNAT family N-acetyltransferase [Anaerolineales bacterium]